MRMPVCELPGHRSPGRGFAVIAYGKLGGLELGYDSDVDLVFLHAGERGTTDGGKNPIDNSQFYNRLGQRVIHMLTTHTAAGRIYEIDMRLRPSGSAGMLVSHFNSYKEYQSKDAWTWEHQALVRARPVAGDAGVIHDPGLLHVPGAGPMQQAAVIPNDAFPWRPGVGIDEVIRGNDRVQPVDHGNNNVRV